VAVPAVAIQTHTPAVASQAVQATFRHAIFIRGLFLFSLLFVKINLNLLQNLRL
jgi:hypothetical protein